MRLLKFPILALVAFLSGCGVSTVPYNSNSPAAKMREQKLSVPVLPGDDYMTTNMALSPVTVDYFEQEGRRTIKAYSKVRRLTKTHTDDDDFRYTVVAQIALEKSGSTFRTLTEKINWTNTLDLNDLCTEDIPQVPERLVVTMLRVEKETKRPIIEEQKSPEKK